MASVYQMLRGGLTVFACLLSIKYLEKKVKKYEWYAIGSICVGLVVVGVASVFGSGDEQQNSWVIQLYGVLLILLGQAIQAAQMVVEEHLLKNVDAPPLLMVGVEGIWGILIMAPVMWIIQYTPSCTDDSIGCQLDQKVFHEDSTESFRMVGESESIRWVLVIYFMGILFFNICGLQVIKLLSAVHRTVLESLRIVFVRCNIHHLIMHRFGSSTCSSITVLGLCMDTIPCSRLHQPRD